MDINQTFIDKGLNQRTNFSTSKQAELNRLRRLSSHYFFVFITWYTNVIHSQVITIRYVCPIIPLHCTSTNQPTHPAATYFCDVEWPTQTSFNDHSQAAISRLDLNYLRGFTHSIKTTILLLSEVCLLSLFLVQIYIIISILTLQQIQVLVQLVRQFFIIWKYMWWILSDLLSKEHWATTGNYNVVCNKGWALNMYVCRVEKFSN